jgi:hypothetical protein
MLFVCVSCVCVVRVCVCAHTLLCVRVRTHMRERERELFNSTFFGALCNLKRKKLWIVRHYNAAVDVVSHKSSRSIIFMIFPPTVCLRHTSNLWLAGGESINGVVTCYRPDSWIWIPVWAKDFLFLIPVLTSPGAHLALCTGHTAHFPGSTAFGAWSWSPIPI